MSPADLLLDAYGRLDDLGSAAVADLDPDLLAHRPVLPGHDAPGNSIAWLVWHAARVMDDHVAGVMDDPPAPQVYVTDGFADRFALPLPASDIGYGHTSAQVDQVRASEDLLAGYLAAVCARTLDWLPSLAAEDLDRVVDEGWDPPVTLGARLVSVLGDVSQHLGQAAYLRGLLGA